MFCVYYYYYYYDFRLRIFVAYLPRHLIAGASSMVSHLTSMPQVDEANFRPLDRFRLPVSLEEPP